jgi:hypothetical protein
MSISNYLDFKLFSDIVKERYTSLNLPSLYQYVVLDTKFYNESIFDGFYSTLIRLSCDVVNLVTSLLALMYYLLILIVKSIFLIFPHAVKLSKSIVKFHREKLRPSDIAVELAFFLLVLLYLYFRKRLHKAWKQFQNNVARKSKKAAKVLPHVLFFMSAVLIAYFGSKFLLPLTSKRVLPVFTVVIPLLKTLQTLRKTTSSTVTTPEHEKEHIETVILWIVLSIYFALGAACESIPFSSVLLSYSLYVREFTLVTAVWVQASPACANLVFETVHPLIQHYTDKIPAAGLGSSASVDSVFLGLKFMGVSERVVRGLKGLLEDSVAVLVCAVFLFLPGRLANIGVIIIALLLPAYKSSNCVFIAREQAAGLEKRKALPPSSSSSSSLSSSAVAASRKVSSMTPLMWLEYWTCLGVLMLLRFYNVRLWASSMMLLCLWLQNANFHGSSVVLVRVVKFVNVLLCYKRKEEPLAVTDADAEELFDSGAAAAAVVTSSPSRVKKSATPAGVSVRSGAKKGGGHQQEEEGEEEEGEEEEEGSSDGEEEDLPSSKSKKKK